MAAQSLTEGSVLRSLFRLSGPIVLANFLQTAYQLTDTFWVGRLGTDEVAALALSFPVIFFLISLGSGFAVSGTILVSQYAGQRNDFMVSKVCYQTLFVILVVSVFFAVIGFALVPFLIGTMTDNRTIYELSVSYLRISFFGLVFSYLYMMFQSLYRGVGDVKTPFYIVLVAVVLNFILDPFFIMGFGSFDGYGVDGAAYTTVATQGVAAVLGLYFLGKGKGGIKLDFRKPELDFKSVKKILSLGLPASTEQSARSLAMIFMTFLVASFGETVLAAYGVVIRVLSLIIIPSLGFSMATSALVGQNIGAGKFRRTHQITATALWVIFVVLTLAGAFFYFFAEQTLAIFVPAEAAVIAEGSRFIRIIALTFGFIGLHQVASGALRGGGATLMSMMIAIVSLWVIRFPVAYVLSQHTYLEQVGVYWSFVGSAVLGAAISLFVIRRGLWINDVTDPVEASLKEIILEETITEDGRASD